MSKITTTCYGETREWESREDAIQFYVECSACSEGAERGRYTTLILQLLQGQTDCHD